MNTLFFFVLFVSFVVPNPETPAFGSQNCRLEGITSASKRPKFALGGKIPCGGVPAEFAAVNCKFAARSGLGRKRHIAGFNREVRKDAKKRQCLTTKGTKNTKGFDEGAFAAPNHKSYIVNRKSGEVPL